MRYDWHTVNSTYSKCTVCWALTHVYAVKTVIAIRIMKPLSLPCFLTPHHNSSPPLCLVPRLSLMLSAEISYIFLWKWNIRVCTLFLFVWLLALRFFRVSCINRYYFFYYWLVFHGTYTPNLFTDSLAHAHVGFYFLAFIKKAAMIFESKVLCGHCFPVSWVDRGNGETVTVASYVFAFLRRCQSGFQCGGLVQGPTSRVWTVVVLHLCQHLMEPDLLALPFF